MAVPHSVSAMTSIRDHKSPSLRPLRRAGVLGVAVLTALGLTAGPAAAATANDKIDRIEQGLEKLADKLDRADRNGATSAPGDADLVQQGLENLVTKHRFPAALASVRGRDGQVRNHTAGVGDLKTRSEVPVDGYVRIGSNTKTFTAVLVLQLVEEGKVELDAPVEKYLPGLIRGNGNDGRRITVRQVLQHTSGLPNYTNFFADKGLEPFQHTYFQPLESLRIALRQKRSFKPGTKWEYSNTNYTVAGLIVEKVTGRPYIEELNKRIIQKIGLQHTYMPNVGDQSVREPHPKGYHVDDPKKPLKDFTESDPSFGWAAGQMIARPSDVNRFFLALLNGELIGKKMLKEMQQTVPAAELGEGARYGLGIASYKLSCGRAWGHGGDIPGYHTTNAATEDGRAAIVALTRLPRELKELESTQQVLDDALCKG